MVQFHLKRDSLTFHFTANECDDLADKIADAHRGFIPMILFENRPDACNNLAGTMAVVDNSLQDVAHLIEIGICLCKQSQADASVCDERRQWLVDFVRNRSGHRSYRCLLGSLCELPPRCP